MKTSLSHLPEAKQKEIIQIVQIIKEEAIPEKVILFGSYAKNKWINDEYKEDGITFSYLSDYDFLVIIKNDGRKEHQIASNIENKCIKFDNWVSPVVHDIDYVNKGLSFGQYFFKDIINEGILLYDSGNFELSKPKQLTFEEQKEKAKEYFNEWFPSGVTFLEAAKFCVQLNDYKIAAFQLHQACERFYSAILTVYIGYKPKTHHLNNYRKYSKNISVELDNIFLFPKEDQNEYHLFTILKRSYIDGRYRSAGFSISKLELELLIEKVSHLMYVSKNLCEKKIASLEFNDF